MGGWGVGWRHLHSFSCCCGHTALPPRSHPPAEQAAEKVKRQLALEWGVPLLPPLPTASQRETATGPEAADAADADAAAAAAAAADMGDDAAEQVGAAAGGSRGQQQQQQQQDEAARLHPYNVRKAAASLARHGEHMPAWRRAELEGSIRRYLAHERQQQQGEQGEQEQAGEAPAGLSDADLHAGLLAGRGGGGCTGESGEWPGLHTHPNCPPSLPTPSPPPPPSPAGLGPRTRRRTLRRWHEQGRPLPAELRGEAEAAACATAAGGSAGGGACSNDWGGGEEEVWGGEEGEADAAEAAAEEARQRREARGGGGGCAPATAAATAAGLTEGPSDLRGASGHAWHGAQVVAAAQAGGGEAALLELCKRFRLAFVGALQPQVRVQTSERACLHAWRDGSGWWGGGGSAGSARASAPCAPHTRPRPGPPASPNCCNSPAAPPPRLVCGPRSDTRVWGEERVLRAGAAARASSSSSRWWWWGGGGTS